MKLRYISIPLHLLSNEYLEKLGKSWTSKLNNTLVYEIPADFYFVPVAPATSYDREFVCNSEQEFIQKIEQIKLMDML